MNFAISGLSHPSVFVIEACTYATRSASRGGVDAPAKLLPMLFDAETWHGVACFDVRVLCCIGPTGAGSGFDRPASPGTATEFYPTVKLVHQGRLTRSERQGHTVRRELHGDHGLSLCAETIAQVS
jgi:hypothetical protein